MPGGWTGLGGAEPLHAEGEGGGTELPQDSPGVLGGRQPSPTHNRIYPVYRIRPRFGGPDRGIGGPDPGLEVQIYDFASKFLYV